jgi:sugar/nucleoside kinase (ribokinase family)
MTAAPDVVCLGILVADVIARPVDDLPARGSLGAVDEIDLRGGGCALNTASALVKLGLRAAVAGKVGADPFGDFLLGVADERGVDRSAVVRDPASPTSATVVLVAGDGDRTFLHVPGANGRLHADELDHDRLFGGRALHIGGALVMERLDGEPFARILAEAKARGLVTSLDTVWDPTGRWERLLPVLPHVDLAAPSLAEAQAITGEEDPDRAAERLHEYGATDVVLKLGAHGCFVRGFGQIEPVPIDAVDGTGAGDAFAAGLLYGRLMGWPLDRAARLANAAGALATTAVGAGEGVRELKETLEVAGLG